MANIGYALDITGKNPLNKVTETRTLTKKAVDGRAIVIPKATPFFAESAVIYKNGIPLVKDHDYQIILESLELSLVLEHDIRAGFIFNTVGINEEISIEIQTVGGDFNLPIGNTVENTVRLIRNPIFTTWSQLTGTPIGLPTFTHIHDFSATVGYEQFIASIDRLANVVGIANGGGDGQASAALLAHINSPSAHTKAQVGLDQVGNFPLAQDADFNKAPYVNNKYVTPRTVMFAINLYIGDQLKDQSKLIDALSITVKENTTAYQALLTEWEDLKSSLTSVSNNYDKMVISVNQYKDAVTKYEAEIKAINENQKQWLAQLQNMDKTLQGYSKDYNAIIETKDALLAKMRTLENAYNAAVKSIEEANVTITSIGNELVKVQQQVMYPDVKVIPAGSYHFRIKPSESYMVTLIGAGGGVGEFVSDDISLVPFCKGENGGSTSLWCMQNFKTGEWSPSSEPIAVAGGGFGGEASFGSTPTNVTKYGLGGRGGNFKILNGITIDEASNGEGGIKGYGNYIPGEISKQDTGYDHYGSKWGRGALRENALGQGGEGAIARITLANTTKVELEFMIQVGASGRSYNPDKGTSVGGLAVLTKIKK